MENNLEQLLNSLIEKGWKPFGEKCKTYEWIFLSKSTRDLASKESGLWQFVCGNGMYKKEALGVYFNDERAKNVFYKIDKFDEEGDVIQTGDMEGDRFIHMSEPEFRLIESALKDENELEDFLLSNIKL